MKAQRWITPANRRSQGGVLDPVNAAYAVGPGLHVAASGHNCRRHYPMPGASHRLQRPCHRVAGCERAGAERPLGRERRTTAPSAPHATLRGMLMKLATPRRSRIHALLLVTAVLGMLLAYVLPAGASHAEVSLPGSDFEIDTDANLKVDDPAPSQDWANVTEIRKADTPSGPTDESFGQGTKEDTAVPTVVDGSIPPNKSDLKFFGLYQEGSTTGGFLNLYWSRVQEPQGTTNMDFEFNQKRAAADQGNGVTPLRTAGDLLVIYDLAQGGTRPVLSIREWNGSAWGPATNLTESGKATGSINTSLIPAGEADGLGAHSARTFGEAQIALSAIFDPNACESFGSAYLKSRSSDSFTAALKDFVPPQAITLSNCGSVKITKTDDASPANPLAGAEFTLYKDNDPTGGTRGPEDTITTKTCTTGTDGTCEITGVLQGQYWVVETKTPPNHDTAADQHITVVADEQVPLTFVNPRQPGSVKITKLDDATPPNPLAGAEFTLYQDNDPTGGTRGPEDTITTKTCTTGTDGTCEIPNVVPGEYWVVETVTPTGHDTAADQHVTVTANEQVSVTFVNVRQPGSVKITKTDDADPANPLAGAEFTLYEDNAPTGGTRGAEDIATNKTCTTGADGTCTISDVLPGEYWVVETKTPPNHDTAADQHVTVTANQQVSVSFVDPRHRGAILVTKTRKHAADGPGDHPHAGVDFTVNGVTKTTDANGQACFDGLLFGDYTVHETTPAGYNGEADKTVTVNNKAACADDPYVGETVSFSNTPLSNITVSFESQVPGGTAATIQCTGLTADPPDETPNVFDDTSETFKDLEPGTYTCTVVVDP
jgi:formamidopyrimidine-DNA glycosylase